MMIYIVVVVVVDDVDIDVDVSMFVVQQKNIMLVLVEYSMQPGYGVIYAEAFLFR